MTPLSVRLCRRKNGGLNFRPVVCIRYVELTYAFSDLDNVFGCHVIPPSETKRIPNAFHYHLKTGSKR